MNKDKKFLKRCFTLAKKGTGRVSPNPLVGAVIVKDNNIIAEGYHHAFGKSHAELDAISKVDPKELSGASIYINLEPCSHQGKTPPCSLLIRDSGIKEVIYSNSDPNPLTLGKSDKIFKDAGITVKKNILCEEGFLINKAFFTNIHKKRSFVTLKLATTMDGKISDFSYNSRWISGPNSKKIVHGLRYACDAVMGGINTVLYDDPMFTIREHHKKKPILRIILDSDCRIPLDSNIVKSTKENPALVVCKRVTKEKKSQLEKMGVSVWTGLESGLKTLFERLYSELNIGHIFSEGGGRIAGSLVKEGLADQLIMNIAPKILGERAIPAFYFGKDIPISDTFEYSLSGSKIIGEDIMIKYHSKELLCLQDWWKK